MRLSWKLMPQKGVNGHKEMEREVKTQDQSKTLSRELRPSKQECISETAWQMMLCPFQPWPNRDSHSWTICYRAWLWKAEAVLLPEQLAESRKTNAGEEMNRQMTEVKVWEKALQRLTFQCFIEWQHAVLVLCFCNLYHDCDWRGQERRGNTQVPQRLWSAGSAEKGKDALKSMKTEERPEARGTFPREQGRGSWSRTYC